MGLKPLDGFPAGGVDSRSNPIVMPVDRYLQVHDFWPREDGSFQLRDGYTLLVNGLQPSVPIHSIASVIGPGPGYKPLLVLWQGTTPYVFDWTASALSSPVVRGTPIASGTRFSYFYTNGHLHAFNGTDAKWFDGITWRDIGLPLPPAAIDALQVVQSVTEFSTDEAAAVTLTLASSGTFPADSVGRTFYCPFYNLDLQEIGPATIGIGPNDGAVKFAVNQELQIAVLPNISSATPRWVKLPALTGDGDQKARFATVSTKQITGGVLANQTFALTRSSASANPSQFPAASFSAALSAANLNSGPATATISGAEQTVPDPTIPTTLTVTITGAQRSKVVTVLGGGQFGQDQTHTVYDSGTCTLQITGADGFNRTYTVTYGGQFETTSDVASKLAAAINADASQRFTASLAGAVITVTDKVSGRGVLYSVTHGTLTSDPTDFGANTASFHIAVSVSQFGDRTSYDSGTVTVSINGTAVNASYGANDTTSSVAASLSAALNAANLGVSAAVAGSVVTIAASGSSEQVVLTVNANGYSVDDVVGISLSGDSSFDGHIFTVIAAATNTVTLNIPNGSTVITSGTIQKLLSVPAGTTTATIAAPAFFTPYLVNADRGVAASAIEGAQPGYQFYASLYMPNAGKHVGNRVTIGPRIDNSVRSNFRLVGSIPLADSEQVLLIGRTSDGAEVPYAVVDLNANWVTWNGMGPSFLIDGAETGGSSELPSRNFPPPGTLDYNAQIALLDGQLNLPQQAQVTNTFSRAWVESDHMCGTIEGSPTIYRSGSALDMREGVFVGLPEQSWDPADIETFPTGEPVTCGQGYNQESWIFTRQNSAALMELAGETQWQGPWNLGCAGQFAWTLGWQNMPFWVTGEKQLATISNGGYLSQGGMTSNSAAGPITVSDEYESTLLSKIGDQYLDQVEVVYIRHPLKRVHVLRIKCLDSNGFPFTVIHDFNLRDDRSPYGQGYLELLGGPVAGWFTLSSAISRTGGLVTAVLPFVVNAVPGQSIALNGWSDESFNGEFIIASAVPAGGNTTVTWAQTSIADGTAKGGMLAFGPSDAITPNFTQAIGRDQSNKQQVVAGGPDGNLYLLYSGSDDNGNPFQAEALALRYVGPDRTAIKKLEWYGDQTVRWFMAKKLSTQNTISQMTELTADGPTAVQGEVDNNHWEVTIDSPEMVHVYVLLRLASHVDDGSTALSFPPHMPVENYGRVWVATPLLGASRGK
jgi:hypothetical protein